MKCVVPRCENHDHRGHGQRMVLLTENGTMRHIWMCQPCWLRVTSPSFNHPTDSQLYKDCIRTYEWHLSKKESRNDDEDDKERSDSNNRRSE